MASRIIKLTVLALAVASFVNAQALNVTSEGLKLQVRGTTPEDCDESKMPTVAPASGHGKVPLTPVHGSVPHKSSEHIPMPHVPTKPKWQPESAPHHEPAIAHSPMPKAVHKPASAPIHKPASVHMPAHKPLPQIAPAPAKKPHHMAPREAHHTHKVHKPAHQSSKPHVPLPLPSHIPGHKNACDMPMHCPQRVPAHAMPVCNKDNDGCGSCGWKCSTGYKRVGNACKAVSPECADSCGPKMVTCPRPYGHMGKPVCVSGQCAIECPKGHVVAHANGLTYCK
ncbi:uncharacterized protein L969DRAFT_95475 [Mixia osmundae IAM 14324]|uniref:Uncharacterized protein n=1 Tax=Mixia osmundae (strain CBS 9802 / IAM 14324 / JCM 22182 / KY 12970) TaxID=764103 RepID=G7E7I3_MIXOS|nr:uncharacterized protein L969DRAFT_95475 [Mixia osmundae IAM 14324]KEI38396.1 hypothetical protein L969DRAFT_95475 [Mixia osmundae IAM 14324]GAA98793.1 hypothetical protein E5Q_05481 [Mixia osmundae IAM 14324]